MGELFLTASYMAHGYCLLWQPWLLALHAVPDLFIFAAYTSIPVMLIRLLRLRPELKRYGGLIGLFAAFILLCGLTHLVGLVTLWFPVYALHGGLKALTAVVSVVTAAFLVPLIPKLARLPSRDELVDVNSRLRAEVSAHEDTLRRLADVQRGLEDRVEERTSEVASTLTRLRHANEDSITRERNLLTLAQKIAQRSETDVVAKARLAALVRSMELAATCNRGPVVELSDLVSAELATLPPGQRERAHATGPAFHVAVEPARQLALLCHEMLRLSCKCGALATAAGQCRLSWMVDDEFLRFTFVERDGADWIARTEDDADGDKSLLLSACRALDATVMHKGSGMNYGIDIPLDRVAAGSAPSGSAPVAAA